MTLSLVEDGVRALRLGAFSATATVLALGAHVLAGGAPPAVLATVAAVALPAVAAVALSRRRRRFLEISVVLGAVQVVLHELFSAAPAGGSGHAHLAHVGHSSDPWMPVTHTLAVVATALLLAYGEQVLRLMAVWWRAVPAVLRAAVVPAIVGRSPVLAVAARLRCGSLSLRACSSVVRRGPPGCSC